MAAMLDGVRVLEMGGRAAAVCGRLFAQLGADVLITAAADSHSAPGDPTIKGSEHRPGVPIRPDPAGRAEHTALTANKREVTLDLTTAMGRAAFEQLAHGADFVVLDLPPAQLEAWELLPTHLHALNPRLVVATITPFGLAGPRRDQQGGDLITFHGSGIARLLIGHVYDAEAEPPVRAAGDQSDVIAGLTTACAAMHALYQQQRTGAGQLIDVSAQEAMALMAARELAMPGFGGQPAPRAGRERGGNAVISVLPARDGYVAISPRETHQWQRWLAVLGSPQWGAEPRFATRAARTKHFAELFALMAQWSREHTCREIFTRCQEAHVPCFPFGEPAAMLDEPQLLHRRFFAPLGGTTDGPRLPRPPFGLPPADYVEPDQPLSASVAWRPDRNRHSPITLSTPSPIIPSVRPKPMFSAPTSTFAAPVSPLPLSGIRVLDFSWVIAGPTCTRYLALMGAQVIKVEAPDKPDTGRVSELHDVLGQSKLALSIDLKAPGARKAIQALLRETDVVVENFATGVMERLGLGYRDLCAVRPEMILLSASGLGRSGPGSQWVAYGNLLSAYSGFATLNDPTDGEPRTGLAWADPLCGLFMAFAVVAALSRRDHGGGGRHIDFSMLEGLLWTLPAALRPEPDTNGRPRTAGNMHPLHAPHNVYRCAGDDRWLAIAVTDDEQWQALCGLVPDLAPLRSLAQEQRRSQRATIDAHLAAWTRTCDDIETMELLRAAGVPASASYTTNDLFADAHLWERGFYQLVTETDGTQRFLPGLPWRWGDGSQVQPQAAPAQGQDNEYILRTLAGLSTVEYTALRDSGALGTPHQKSHAPGT